MATGKTLVVVVVNAPKDSSTQTHEKNRETLSLVQPGETRPMLQFRDCPEFGPLVMVDRASEGRRFSRPSVGLARKIGGDLAVALIYSGAIENGWIAMTDADARVPDTYWQILDAAPPNGVAALVPFTHVPNPDVLPGAIWAYEISLRYYVLGLRAAGSPYAFHTIGSTISVTARAYCAVRGIPKREAGEDFWFLNKIRKVGQIYSMIGEPVRLSGRISDRVPFGTGAAMRRWSSERIDPENVPFYHPDVFSVLGVGLDVARRAAEQDRVDEAALMEQVLAGLRRRGIDQGLLAPIESTGLFARWVAAHRRAKSVSARRRQMIDALDGFRTLKLIHALRESGLPSLPLRSALRRARFVPTSEGPLEELAQKLARVEATFSPESDS